MREFFPGSDLPANEQDAERSFPLDALVQGDIDNALRTVQHPTGETTVQKKVDKFGMCFLTRNSQFST